MSFIEKFKKIIESCEDLQEIALIGKDGIIVDSTFTDEILEGLTIEFSTIINKVSIILDAVDDKIKEQIMITDNHTILIKPISDYYFIVLFMKESGNIGKARFVIRKNSLWFQEAIR
jgi:predicted regulator of Ras-like GTPase activity (Roadblock/LC7/MglB family)